MAKTESTAVNELIGLVQSKKPMASEPAEDLFSTPPVGRTGRAASPAVAASHPARMTSTIPPMRGAGDVAPLPRARAPQSTAEQSMPDSRVRMSTAPSPRGSTIPPLPPRGAAGTLPPPTAPVAAPFESLPAALAKLSSPDLPVPRTDLVISADETWVGTLAPTRTREEHVSLAKKLIIPGIACIAAGIALGFYVSGNKSTSSSNKTPTTASAPSPATASPAAPPTETVLHPTARSAESANAGTSTAGGVQPEPPTKAEQAAQVAAAAAEAGTLTNDAPAAAIAQVADAPKGMVKLTDVRIDSEPQGASITLVDRGKQFPLGSTPLSTSLDSSRQYDVIIELPGRPSQSVHLDPASTSRLAISLGRKQRAAAPAVDAVAAPPKAATAAKADAAPEIAAIEPKKTKTEAKTKTDAKVDVASSIDAIADAKAKPEAAVAANGTLMVSSKPPCEIHIDGAATGLTTPQRSIELAPGKHKITFVNQDAGIKKTVSVTIKAGEPTKLIQDLMTK